jgi:hypothetical protein
MDQVTEEQSIFENLINSEQALRMLEEIGTVDKIPQFIEEVKAKKRKLMVNLLSLNFFRGSDIGSIRATIRGLKLWFPISL